MKYAAIGKWRMPGGAECQACQTCHVGLYLGYLGLKIGVCLKDLKEPRNLGNSMIFFSLVLFLYLLLGFLNFLARESKVRDGDGSFLVGGFRRVPMRLCDLSLANCTNALAIDPDVASWRRTWWKTSASHSVSALELEVPRHFWSVCYCFLVLPCFVEQEGHKWGHWWVL